MTHISRAMVGSLRAAVAALLAGTLLISAAQVAHAEPPDNDQFASATEISTWKGLVEATNVGATKEDGEPNHDGVLGAKSVWYSWTAPQSGHVVFDTLNWSFDEEYGGGLDTVLAVYTGEDVADLTTIASNDDVTGFSPFQSRLTFYATEATVYKVAVDGVAGKSGSFRLHWAMRAPNDDFGAPGIIKRRTGSVNSDNALATRQAGEPRFGQKSIWYSWKAPATRTFQFTTRGSDYDTVLAVYTGRLVNRLKTVAANDDVRGYHSRVRFRAVEGRTYRIMVGSYHQSWSGATQLSWRRL